MASDQRARAAAEATMERYATVAANDDWLPAAAPRDLAEAVWILQRDGADPAPASVHHPALNVLVDVALAFGQETQPAEAWWDGVEATIRALSATARIGVIGDCAALAARLDASRYYDLAKSLGLDDLTLGRCAPALVVELMQISKPMATPPGSEVAQALMACVRASRGEDLFAELAALAQSANPGPEAAEGWRLCAMALARPAEAYRLHEQGKVIAGSQTSTDAYRVLARFVAETEGEAELVARILAMDYHSPACEWLVAAAADGTISPTRAEETALELAASIEECLDPFSWVESIIPLGALAARVRSSRLVDALCHHYLPPGEGVAATLALNIGAGVPDALAPLADFLAALEASGPLAECFDPPEDLLPAPWRTVPSPWRITVADASHARRREVAHQVLRVAAASPFDPEIWSVLGPLLTARLGRRPLSAGRVLPDRFDA